MDLDVSLLQEPVPYLPTYDYPTVLVELSYSKYSGTTAQLSMGQYSTQVTNIYIELAIPVSPHS